MIVQNTLFFYRLSQNHVNWLFWMGIICVTLEVFAYLLLLWAIYHLVAQKIGVFYWLLLLLGIISILMDTFVYRWGCSINLLLFITLINIDIFRVAYKAIKNNKKGASIIAVGGICAILSWIIACLQMFANLILIPIDFISVTILCIPIAVAIYLGYDFALTNRSLKQKLVENEKLFGEKQLILSTQNETLEKQVEARTAELKATQNQLIQKEKLASMGELTAGIAHEIQNPLNFVNNFSELSVDLVKDLKDEIEKPDIDKEYVGELLTDLTSNQEKINHHGKRASNIVKGMLEHSRASTGVKELTDINKLADEYLRLAYHGLRAKDNTFNADYELIGDENLPKIEVIPQDIGRVLLNLINNAFYAVNQRKLLSNDASYTPSVSVTTQHLDNQIIIKVKDNGIGMSEAIKAKVFQPFFTTKPTGSGTGLGLSLAYDIVMKGHGGTLEVESAEGKGTTFTVKLSTVGLIT